MTAVEHKGRIIFLEENLLHFFQIISMSTPRKSSLLILSFCRGVILKSIASSLEQILKGKEFFQTGIGGIPLPSSPSEMV